MFLLLLWLAKKGTFLVASHYAKQVFLAYLKARITVKTERAKKALTAVETAVDLATTDVCEAVAEKGVEVAVKYTRKIKDKITRKFQADKAA